METEIWRDIEGYEGLYQVSNFGRVKSLNYRHTGKEKILKPWKHRDGYLQVDFRKNGKRSQYLVHRLVAQAFIPNPYNLPEVNHKNENKEDNRVENLEWCNRKYNTNYGTRNDRVAEKLINREDLSKPVLCVEKGIVFPSAKEAFRKTGVNFTHISQCCHGERKTAGGYHWQYAE